jgi:hypothetical protein
MRVLFRQKTALAMLLLASVFCAGLLMAQVNKPATVIHVVTVKWKEGTTPAQIKAAIAGVEKMAAKYPGITRVWLRSIKVQGEGYTHAFVMEFASEKALADYAGSAAQKEWYEVYLPIREESTTHDITN